MTVGRRDLQSFLGRKNFKGIYVKNPLARTPAYANFDRRKAFLTSYPLRGRYRQGRLTDWSSVFAEDNVQRSYVPFEHNKFTKSNELIGLRLRRAIVGDHAAGETTQKLSFKYGISVPRVDAVVRLEKVKSDLEEVGKLTKEMKKMARHMRSYFTEISTDETGLPQRQVDNLTEIPIPKETRTQRFLSIAESEPFGPIDAATVLDIEPAAVTLDKLGQVADEPAKTKTNDTREPVSFYAPRVEGEKARFRFTDAKVGNVGFRYGASRDDRKHARRVRFLPNGNMTYPLPEHS